MQLCIFKSKIKKYYVENVNIMIQIEKMFGGI